MILKDMILKYLEYSKQIKSSASTHMEWLTAERIFRYIDQYHITELNVDLLNNMVVWFKNSTLCCNKTINVAIKYLRMVYRFNDVPFEYLMNYQMLKETHRHYELLTKEEQKSIFDYVNQNRHKTNTCIYRVMIYVLYDTGIRQNELIHIKTSHLDLNEKCIYLEFTKTHYDRYVYFSDRTKAILEEYIHDFKPKEYLFTHDERLFSKDDFRVFFRRLRRNTGLIKAHTHMFRHTLATELLENGCNLLAVQKQLGHKSLASTQAYLHMSSKKQKEHIIGAKR